MPPNYISVEKNDGLAGQKGRINVYPGPRDPRKLQSCLVDNARVSGGEILNVIEIHGIGQRRTENASLELLHRTNLRALDTEVYSISQQTASQRDGRERNRRVPRISCDTTACFCIDAASGAKRAFVFVSQGAEERSSVAQGRGTRQAACSSSECSFPR